MDVSSLKQHQTMLCDLWLFGLELSSAGDVQQTHGAGPECRLEHTHTHTHDKRSTNNSNAKEQTIDYNRDSGSHFKQDISAWQNITQIITKVLYRILNTRYQTIREL